MIKQLRKIVMILECLVTQTLEDLEIIRTSNQNLKNQRKTMKEIEEEIDPKVNLMIMC